MACEQVAGQRSCEIGQDVAKTRVSPWNRKELNGFDEAGAGQRNKSSTSKTNTVQTQAGPDWDEEDDIQQQIHRWSLATLQTPERKRFVVRRWSKGETSDCNQTGQQQDDCYGPA